jgi:hypothetical protein
MSNANNWFLAATTPPAVSEGSECPTCKRRVPYPKKATSPETKVVAVPVPIDSVETFKEMLDAAARAHGLLEKKHHRYWTLLHGLVLLLQEPAK